MVILQGLPWTTEEIKNVEGFIIHQALLYITLEVRNVRGLFKQ
jgi:hypothetical protein